MGGRSRSRSPSPRRAPRRGRSSPRRRGVGDRRGGEALPVDSLPDVGEAVSRLRVGGVLGPAELKALAKVLASARSLRRFLQARRATAPALNEACSTNPTLDDLADEVAGSFEPDGTLSDRASPRLRELRSEWQTSRQRMISGMEEMMRRYEGVLQDASSPSARGAGCSPCAATRTSASPGSFTRRARAARRCSWSRARSSRWATASRCCEAEVQREEEAVYTRADCAARRRAAERRGGGAALALADVRAATAGSRPICRCVFPEVVDRARRS